MIDETSNERPKKGCENCGLWMRERIARF